MVLEDHNMSDTNSDKSTESKTTITNDE